MGARPGSWRPAPVVIAVSASLRRMLRPVPPALSPALVALPKSRDLDMLVDLLERQAPATDSPPSPDAGAQPTVVYRPPQARACAGRRRYASLRVSRAATATTPGATSEVQ
jgi:hypothetical protein